jgi:hypothetical protein
MATEPHDTITGEVLPDPGQAGGEADRSFAVFIGQLEDGYLNVKASELLRQLNHGLHDHITSTGARSAKGTLKLTLSFELKDGAFEVVGELKLDMPKERRPRSIMWSTPGGNFSPENPRQQKLPFGVRTVGGGEGMRTI